MREKEEKSENKCSTFFAELFHKNSAVLFLHFLGEHTHKVSRAAGNIQKKKVKKAEAERHHLVKCYNFNIADRKTCSVGLDRYFSSFFSSFLFTFPSFP